MSRIEASHSLAMKRAQLFSRSSSEVSAAWAVWVFLCLIAWQFLSWTVGDDPATLARAETAAVSESLAALRVVPTNVFLPVNDSSPYRWILGTGFSEPEADGTWIVSTEATLEFSVEGSRPTAVRLSMSPFLADGATSKRIEVETSATRRTIDLGTSGRLIGFALDGDPHQQVRVRCETLEAPTEAESAADRRGLCVKLFVVEVVD